MLCAYLEVSSACNQILRELLLGGLGCAPRALRHLALASLMTLTDNASDSEPRNILNIPARRRS